MIPRYSRPAMAAIWEEERKFSIILEIELLVCEAQCEFGRIPVESMRRIRENSGFDLQRILEIEKLSKHDLIAFLTSVAEMVGKDSRYIHHGLTSSDVLDTCFALQLRESLSLIIPGLKKVLEVLRAQAHKYKDVLCMGRTHGMHAEPTSLGLKFARFYAEFERSLKRILRIKEEISVCALSGAVGTYSILEPEIEEYVAKRLQLSPELVSSQVLPRDRFASFFTVMAILAGSIENCVTEIRNLQRSEIAELRENFSQGQKGSSAMPHKRNPILSENLSGISRLIRMAVTPALENITLWHERDISHSSVERVIAPDVCILVDFALQRLSSMLTEVVVDFGRIAANVSAARGLFWSQRVMLRLVDLDMPKEEAYSLVQSVASKVWNDSSLDFCQMLLQDARVSGMLGEELLKMFESGGWLRNVDMIFARVFPGLESYRSL